MNEKNYKNYKKRFDFQQNIISKKSEEIESLNAEIVKLRLQIEEKDNVIASIEPMRVELTENIKEHKRLKEEYKSLINELKMMKKIMTQEVYKSQWKWKLIKFLIK